MATTRVILLLDLDCFYAQCERIRLGLEQESCCLALLQWNSCLAVTYPARKFGIQRGDSWDAVAKKSQGACLAIHLPLLETGAENTNNSSAAVSVKEAYQQAYRLTESQRKQIMENEIGRRRSTNEGKACLERYRLASTRIFGVVVESIQELLGKGNFVLERASIDELFLDVSKFCWQDKDDIDISSVMKETVQVDRDQQQNDQHDDPDVERALHRGCWVAKQIRASVFDKLGFTLSAGISTSKLVAKLGASYGKPNGQAVIYPSCISSVLEKTPIRKVRNLGGKIGKKVAGLLPDDEQTMGSIARLLSLPDLAVALGKETGQMVFDAARGLDKEPVVETTNVLVKSITASKSFNKTRVTSGEFIQWLELLATEIVSRVEIDRQRNSRYPKSCTVHYAFDDGVTGSDRGRKTKSLRIAFPREHEEDKRGALVTKAKEAIIAKEGKTVFLIRAGLCAIDFEARAVNGGIDSFFSKSSAIKVPCDGDEVAMRSTSSNKAESNSDEGFARKLQAQLNREERLQAPAQGRIPLVRVKSPVAKAATVAEKPAPVDKDLELARKLQADYDRENNMHVLLEKKRGPASKRIRIDNFFSKNK